MLAAAETPLAENKTFAIQKECLERLGNEKTDTRCVEGQELRS